MPFDTLDEAQAEILRLNERLTEVETERDSLSQNNAALTDELGRVRTLNQQYFNKLSAQYTEQEDENNDDEPEVPSCEDLARTTLKNMI